MSRRWKIDIAIGLGLALLLAGFFVVRMEMAAKGRVAGTSEQYVPETFWQYQCIDTMKYSRDVAGQHLHDLTKAKAFIDNEVAIVKSLGANCVAIGTPYDELFLPVLQLWVHSARANDLAVWFRGNFSGWEGWFSYPKLGSGGEHNKLLYDFITSHWDLFKPWDILTPAPEAENGILGNPWRSQQAGEQLRQFVLSSQETCERAQKDAGIQFRCGYVSANGDVAEKIYTPEIAARTGGVVVMDHYISTTARMERDIIRVAKSHKASVVLGEYGAPIPDINGVMTETEQAIFVGGLLEVFYRNRQSVRGINYWVLRGGSTSLLNDDGTLRQAAYKLSHYYKPGRIVGTVQDSRGQPVINARVTIASTGEQLLTDSTGRFGTPILAGSFDVSVSNSDYYPFVARVSVGQLETRFMTIVLEPVSKSIRYQAAEFLYELVH
jgi:hypothetical protein